MKSDRALGHIIRRKEPENLEFPFAALDSYLTPNESFYVRSHFPRPTIERAAWRLAVSGSVERELELTFDELRALPSEVRTVTLECAGNGRVFLVPKANGDNWELGAVSTAEWKGVRLRDVLARAGVKRDAVEIVLIGADKGEPDDTPKPPGKIAFSRAIPCAKADDVLLAYEMNGEPLPSAHGAPVRAIVPGWYGMASVKWLVRIVATAEPFRGYFQSTDYSYWAEQAGIPIRVPLGEMKPKAQIARPGLDEIIDAGREYRIFGAAWAGESALARVEVSTDNGKTFAEATLLGEPVAHAWRLWEFMWRTPSVGAHTLLARASDSQGHCQPAAHEAKYGNYVIWHTLPVDVEVR